MGTMNFGLIRPVTELNQVLLSGVILDEPEERTTREGARITLLQVAFRAPDAGPRDTWPSACCEVEVPAGTPQSTGPLRPGASILVAGQLGGGAGGVVATCLMAGPALDGDKGR